MIKRACKPELLLPAGGPECVRAAVQNGANAVYLGGRLFSARQNAENFSESDLFEAVSDCHAHGVRVYQTLNTLLFDSQWASLAEAVQSACRVGVDALIVQDWGVLRFVREHAPQMRLHGSTQMSVHTPAAVRLLGEMGLSRVVLARELSLPELAEITASADIECEVFVHGALCMAVSGQCYLSAMLGGRSGNRGMCAGPCRLPWRPGRENPGDSHALSLKDLCLLSHLEELCAAGVASLKVEGRMKRPEYVAAAAAAYRKALDGSEPPAPEAETLRAVFSRSGFTDGYLTGKRTAMFGIRQKEDVTAATPKLLKSLQNTYQKERGRVPLSLSFVGRAGEPCRLIAADADQNRAETAGMIPLPAAGRPLDEAAAAASLQKLGGTVFVPGAFRAELGEGLYLPAAELNRMRREVCAAILTRRARLRPIEYRAGSPAAPVSVLPRPPRPAQPVWEASFRRADQLTPALAERFSAITLPLSEVLAHADSLLRWGDKLRVEPPRAMFGREPELRRALEHLRGRGFSRLSCQNLGHLALARELGYEAHGGVFLNCANSASVAELSALGARSQVLSIGMPPGRRASRASGHPGGNRGLRLSAPHACALLPGARIRRLRELRWARPPHRPQRRGLSGALRGTAKRGAAQFRAALARRPAGGMPGALLCAVCLYRGVARGMCGGRGRLRIPRPAQPPVYPGSFLPPIGASPHLKKERCRTL